MKKMWNREMLLMLELSRTCQILLYLCSITKVWISDLIFSIIHNLGLFVTYRPEEMRDGRINRKIWLFEWSPFFQLWYCLSYCWLSNLYFHRLSNPKKIWSYWKVSHRRKFRSWWFRSERQEVWLGRRQTWHLWGFVWPF